MEYNFEKAYQYALNVTIEDLFKRSICYNAYIGEVFPRREGPVGHDVVLSIVGALFGPIGNLTEQEFAELENFLTFIDRGFSDTGRRLEKWLNLHTKTQKQADYFINMYNELMRKSDNVYSLLQQHQYVLVSELLRDIIVPFAKLDSPTKYSDWIYI